MNAVLDDNPIRNAVLLLGSFHTFINLRAIRTLIVGSGPKEKPDTVYGKIVIVHMMGGKSVQQAFRRQLLVDQCLIY